MNESMTATEVEQIMEKYRRDLRIRQIKTNKIINKICLKPLLKRTLISASDYGPITSMICMNIEVKS